MSITMTHPNDALRDALEFERVLFKRISGINQGNEDYHTVETIFPAEMNLIEHIKNLDTELIRSDNATHQVGLIADEAKDDLDSLIKEIEEYLSSSDIPARHIDAIMTIVGTHG